MTIMHPARACGASTALSAFLALRGLVAPDGRALYRYECRAPELEALSASLLDRRYPLEQRVRLVPLVAAENFRRSYREGPWSWEDCGVAVATLRRLAGLQFGPLLLKALSYWSLMVIRGDGMSHQYLETLVVNGGFPVAFVEGYSALRSLLKRLIREYVRGGEGAAVQRAGLEIPISRLPRSYRQSHDFEQLCVEVAGAASMLAREFDPQKHSLSEYLDSIPDLQSRLPFRLDSEAAKQLLRELLETARQATSSGALDSAICVRELHHLGDAWQWMTKLAPLPDSLDLPDGDTPAVLKLGVTADGISVRPLASLSRQPSGRYLVRPRPTASQLGIPSPFDAPDISVGLIAAAAGCAFLLPVRDGDALDASMPWVFVPSDVPVPGASIDRWRFLTQGDGRARDMHVLVCVPQDAIIEGEVTERGQIQFPSGLRRLAQTEGRISVECGGEVYDVRASSLEDSLLIDLRGRRLAVHSPDAGTVFAGAPTAELRDAPVAVLEWKSALGDTWSNQLKGALGLVTYRARVGDAIVARRKALVLPADFKVTFQSSDSSKFRLTLAPGWLVGGMIKPTPVTDSPGQWTVPADASPGSVARVTVLLRPPPSVSRSLASIELNSHAQTSGFRETVSGAPAPPRTSLDRVGHYEACLAKRAGRLIFVSWGGNQTMPVVCELDHGISYGLPLSWISEELRELDASRHGADGRMRIEMIDEGRATSLDVAPVRLVRQGNRILVDADGESVPEQLELTARHFSHDECIRLERDIEGEDAWCLGDTLQPGWSLIAANLSSIRPLAVKIEGDFVSSGASVTASLLQKDASQRERKNALIRHLSSVVSQPLEANNQAEIAFIDRWLQRFRDVPGPYLDVVGGLLGSSEVALRLLAYSGASNANSFAQRARDEPLWWHLIPTSAWRSLADWWAGAMDGKYGGHSVEPAVFDGVVNACADCLHVSEEDRAVFAGVLQNVVICCRLTSPQKAHFAAGARARLGDQLKQWSQCLAAAVEGGAQLPPLPRVLAASRDVARLLPGATPRQCDDERLPYLVAPAVCATMSETGDVSADLRRELVLARRFDRSLFDTLFATARIHLACA
ncbi:MULTISPECIES: STY4851/ECs_5259 family protein [Stenotrophomonas]|uniref:STY4851/ECs_5259 family protein n=1 Tax=Stenotrophomonas TaxID=40323 RepID=UPI0013DA6248|nr:MULTISPECIES: STY4851/ECs_5259 family protein [Stenotrophomonas]MDQ7290244.1 STY4851/ECs_5259 family protein [Stenotrophomonas sp. Sm2128]HDS1829810.1 hypothetical protein [Stenotrophomonas maltophilia]